MNPSRPVWQTDCTVSQHYSSESKLKRGCNAPDRKKLYPDEGSAIDRVAHFLTEVFMEASDWPLVMQKPLRRAAFASLSAESLSGTP